MYTKSILGGFKGHSGHCAYNRTNGAKLVPDPSGNYKEVLRICLTDRWYNPVDDYIGEEAPFVLDITEKSEWQTITIDYDTVDMTAKKYKTTSKNSRLSEEEPLLSKE